MISFTLNGKRYLKNKIKISLTQQGVNDIYNDILIGLESFFLGKILILW